MIRNIRIGEHLTAGDLTNAHIGHYIVIRPEGSEADVMGRLNHVVPVPYRHRIGLELESAWPPQNVWAPAPSMELLYGLDESALVAVIEAFEE